MISFTCACGKALQADDDQGGQGTRCPNCGHEAPVPGGEVAPIATIRPPPITRLAVLAAVLGVLALATNAGSAVLVVLTRNHEQLITLALAGCSFFLAAAAVVLARRWRKSADRANISPWSKRLAAFGRAAGVTNIVLALLFTTTGLPLFFYARNAWCRLQAALDLYKVGIALWSSKDRNGTYPPAAICDADGEPLLSWRVALLPYIGQDALFQKFKLDEPWDGPNNSKLLPQMPEEYALAIDSTAPPGCTYLRVFVGNGAAFEVDRGVRLDEITDGRGNTILVVEAANAVPWTKPDELPYDPNGPLPPLGGHFSGGFWAVMADGSTHFIRTEVSQQTLRAAITRAAGDVVGPDW